MENRSEWSRRDFLKGGAAGLVTASLGRASKLAADQGGEFAILIDTTRCSYCEKCVGACEERHGGEHPGAFYTQVTLTYPQGKVARPLPVSTRCMHCTDAPCTRVCEGKALTKTARGAVTWNEDRCIGCLSCVNVCPFPKSLHYEPSQGKVYKCDMCYDRIVDGANPACVDVCHAYGYDALSFGPFNDVRELGMQKAQEINGVLLYPEQTHTLILFAAAAMNTGMMSRLFGFTPRYSGEARMKADVTQVAHFGWIPVLGGLAYYGLKWRKNRMERPPEKPRKEQ